MAKNKIDWLYHSLSLVVVFIGITAGFFLQNKKDAKNDRRQEQKYFEGFISEIKQDIESLQNFVSDDSTWYSQQFPKLVLMAKDSLIEDSAIALVKSMLMFSEFKPHEGTYRNIINSGNLGLIQDYKVRQKIVEYYKVVEDYGLIDKYFHRFNMETFMPYVFENFDIIDHRFVQELAYKKHGFKNVSAGYLSYKKQRYDGFVELLIISRETLEVLE